MQLRDRIKSLRRVKASTLRPNPRNWRTHSASQAKALGAALEEIGFAGVCLARELPDKTLELLDGHLRAQTAADERVPVLVLDLDDAEAAKLLATFDPLGAMAGVDAASLESLLREVDTGNRLPTFSSTHEALGHAAAFPVGLPAFFISAYTDPGDAVYEPFCGSGSTLIAAEQFGRRCFAIELSPSYCDIAIARWEKFTGRKARRPARKKAKHAA